MCMSRYSCDSKALPHKLHIHRSDLGEGTFIFSIDTGIIQSGTVIYHLYVDVSNTCGWYTSLRMCSGHSVGNCSPCEANMGRHSLKTSCLTTAEWGRRQPAMRRTNASSRGTGTDTHSNIDITRNWSVPRGHSEIRISCKPYSYLTSFWRITFDWCSFDAPTIPSPPLQHHQHKSSVRTMAATHST